MDQPMNETTLYTTLPENYETRMDVGSGLIAGIFGSLGIMVVVTIILVLNGHDIWEAVRLIATVVYGPDAVIGTGPIVIGTIIHLMTGGILGIVFALLLPCMPRGIWVVAGLIYGFAAWIVSTFLILPLLAPPMIAADASVSILLLAHVAYGLILGLASASYKLWWYLPNWRKVLKKAD